MPSFSSTIILLVAVTMHKYMAVTEAIDIGVCYGLNGNNLPSAADTINLYTKYGIGKIRFFEPVPEALEALRGKGIDVTIGVLNNDIPNLALDPGAALQWFSTYVEPYVNDMAFQYIVVGNEIVPSDLAPYIVGAMQNFQNILVQKGLGGVRVTTVVHAPILATSYPPSSAAYTEAALPIMTNILQFLSQTSSPLLINVYPYFAYASDPVNIPLDYVQFTATNPVVVDGALSYSNILDAIVDAFIAAMEKVNYPDVAVVISESGWPSAGNGQLTTPELAATYNRNFINHVTNNGTPKRPNEYLEGFIFAMFNENLKPEGVEQTFGLFNPKMEPVYPVF